MPLHPLVAAGLRAQHDAGWVERHRLGVDAARAQLAARPVDPTPPTPCAVRDEVITPDRDADGPPVRVRRYRGEDRGAEAFEVDRAFVFVHGGGWVLGDLDLSDRWCRGLAARSGCEVVSVDYRLAPEHSFPAALDDVVAVITHLRSAEGRRPLAVGGISAGGNLAAAACIRTRDECGPVPDLQVLVCPVLDASCSSGSYRSMATGYYLTAEDMAWFWQQYAFGDGAVGAMGQVVDDGRGWLSPLHARNVHGLPPALVVNAEYDVLRDEGEAYAARLNAGGVDAASVTFGGVTHGFVSDHRLAPARAATTLVVETLRELSHEPQEARP